MWPWLQRPAHRKRIDAGLTTEQDFFFLLLFFFKQKWMDRVNRKYNEFI